MYLCVCINKVKHNFISSLQVLFLQIITQQNSTGFFFEFLFRVSFVASKLVHVRVYTYCVNHARRGITIFLILIFKYEKLVN